MSVFKGSVQSQGLFLLCVSLKKNQFLTREDS